VKIPQPQQWRQMLYFVGKARGLYSPVRAPAAQRSVPSSALSLTMSHKRKLSGSAAGPSSGSSSVVDGKKRKTDSDKEVATLLQSVDVTEGPPDSVYVSGTLVISSDDLVKAKGKFQIPPVLVSRWCGSCLKTTFALSSWL